MPLHARLIAGLEAVRDEGTVPGVLCSLALHAVLIVLFIVLVQRAPPPVPRAPSLVVLADLVPIAPFTTSPDGTAAASVPQERAREDPPEDHPQAIPKPNETRVTRPPAAVERRKPRESQAAQSESARRDSARGGRAPAEGGDLDSRLQALAQLREPPAMEPPAPRRQDGAGTSNATATDPRAVRGPAAIGVKDFIRAQIARHWYLARGEKTPAGRVSLRLHIDGDGTVAKAEIVDDGRMADPAFERFALGLRNAALLSSPLQLLPGSADAVRDMVLDFSAAEAQR